MKRLWFMFGKENYLERICYNRSKSIEVQSIKKIIDVIEKRVEMMEHEE